MRFLCVIGSSYISCIFVSGADDIISFSNDNFTQNFFDKSIAQSNFINELTSRESYDVIFITTKVQYNTEFLLKFLKTNGKLINTVERDINSDEYGAFMRLFYSVSIVVISFSFLLIYDRLKNDR